ncbi:MAG: DUF5069 domain-containing protein [Candidatus Melainabacteria bacterium]|nr:DUF5069 domain-containing protein [Candidatus Melainabacteria bacterium]
MSVSSAATKQLFAPDLTRDFPRSPAATLGYFNILPRVIDKCRAVLAGTQGEYNFNCPLDEILFEFTGIDADEFKAYVAQGSTDAEILAWVQGKTAHLTEEQILSWAYENRVARPEDDEDRAMFEKMRLTYCPNATHIETWFQLLDAEEGRI